MKLILKRAGTLTVNWKDGEDICGHGVAGPQTYNYVCEITASDTHLDEQGFIIDQITVDDTFRKMFSGKRSLSCEHMSIQAVLKIAELVEYAKTIRVSIGPIPPEGYKGEASISAEWNA